MARFHITTHALRCALLFYNMDKEKMRQRVGQGIRRMFNITLFATLLYMIPWILHYMQSPDMYQIDFIDLVNFVFWGIPLFLPEGIHLWYLQAYLYVLITVLFRGFPA